LHIFISTPHRLVSSLSPSLHLPLMTHHFPSNFCLPFDRIASSRGKPPLASLCAPPLFGHPPCAQPPIVNFLPAPTAFYGQKFSPSPLLKTISPTASLAQTRHFFFFRALFRPARISGYPSPFTWIFMPPFACCFFLQPPQHLKVFSQPPAPPFVRPGGRPFRIDILSLRRFLSCFLLSHGNVFLFLPRTLPPLFSCAKRRLSA